MTSKRNHVVFLVFTLFLAAEPPLSAEENASSADRIAAAAQISVDQLDPEKIADVELTQASFLSSVEGLKAYLAERSDADNAAAWLSYLQVDPVLQGINEDKAAGALALDALKIAQRATGVHPGLEVEPVLTLRQSAEDFSNALRFRRKEQIAAALKRQLESLAGSWAESGDVASPEDVERLQLILKLLDDTGQLVELMEASQSVYGQPNLRLHVDESLVQDVINRKVNQPSPVRDCILGTRIVGRALLSGNVEASLLPSDGSVRMQIALTGSLTSNSYGYNRSVRVKTTSHGLVSAKRVLAIDEESIRLEPVSSSGSLRTRIHRIDHPLKLVRKIARKKAAKQKPLADAIARGKMLNKLSSEFDRDTSKAVPDPSPNLIGEVRPILKRLNIDEPTRRIGSTDDSIYFNATLRSGPQLASPLAPPRVEPGAKVVVQIHESVINNTIGSVLAGRTMSRDELAAMAEKVKPADATASDEDEEDFEIDFDRVRPVIFEARDGVLLIGIRGTRFATGKREIKKRLEIAAKYQAVRSDSGNIILQRDGEMEVSFPGRSRLSASEAGFKAAIKKAFDDAFPEFIMEKPFAVPVDSAVEALQGMTFGISRFDANDGWLSIGIN